jgi:TalC/MipB family fructose-6-phosphate aldolase
MQIWLDTIDFSLIRHARQLGLLAGVTTNPSILAAAKQPVESVLDTLLDLQPGKLAVQVTGDDYASQLRQARRLAAKSDRIVIKIPAVGDGFQTMAALEREGIPTLATAIFESRQIVMAGLLGVHYAAPYLNRIEQAGRDAALLLQESQQILQRQGQRTLIMGAAVKSLEQFMQCARAGIGAVTLPADTYRQLFASTPDVDAALARFDSAWQANPFTARSALFSTE